MRRRASCPSPAPGPSPTIYNMPMTSGPYPRRFAASLLNVQVNALAASATVTPSRPCLAADEPTRAGSASRRALAHAVDAGDRLDKRGGRERALRPCQALRGEELDGEPRRVRPESSPSSSAFKSMDAAPARAREGHPRQFASALDRAGRSQPGTRRDGSRSLRRCSAGLYGGRVRKPAPRLAAARAGSPPPARGRAPPSGSPRRGRPPRPLHP